MRGADGEEVIHPNLQSLRIMGIDHAAEKHAQSLEAQLLGPSQFLADGGMVVGGLASHLYLILGVGRNIIAASHPRIMRIPLDGFLG